MPDFQGQKKEKRPGCGELLRNDQRIRIQHLSKETDPTVHQSGGNICGENNDLCCNRRVLIKTTKARRRKSDIVFRCLGSEGCKYINMVGFCSSNFSLAHVFSPFPICTPTRLNHSIVIVSQRTEGLFYEIQNGLSVAHSMKSPMSRAIQSLDSR